MLICIYVNVRLKWNEDGEVENPRDDDFTLEMRRSRFTSKKKITRVDRGETAKHARIRDCDFIRFCHIPKRRFRDYSMIILWEILHSLETSLLHLVV